MLRKRLKTKLSLDTFQRELIYFKADDLLLFANIFQRIALYLEYQANRKSRLNEQYAKQRHCYDLAIKHLIDDLNNGASEHMAIKNIAVEYELCRTELGLRLERIKQNNRTNELARHKRNKNIINDLLDGVNANEVAKKHKLNPSTVYRIKNNGFNWWQK